MAQSYQVIRSPAALFADAAHYDAAVAQSPGILDFCSSSYWIRAAHQFLHGEERAGAPFLAAHDPSGEHWVAFAKGASWFWEPLENAWAFSCPLIGSNPSTSIDLLEAVCDGEFGGAAAFLLGGIPERGDLHTALMERRDSYRRLVEFEGMACMTIDLTDGIDAYLGRRSIKFRRNLHQCERKVREAGVVIEEGQGSWNEIFDRILRIQQRTLKWLRGDDIFHHKGYLDFYTALAEPALQDGILRTLFARIGEQDIAYILGADFHGTYRGLQMSYAAEHSHLGIGNVLQLENLIRCSADGLTGYDLGMFAPYKEKWTDSKLSFRNILLIR